MTKMNSKKKKRRCMYKQWLQSLNCKIIIPPTPVQPFQTQTQTRVAFTLRLSPDSIHTIHLGNVPIYNGVIRAPSFQSPNMMNFKSPKPIVIQTLTEEEYQTE